MAERLANLFSSPKFKGSRTPSTQKSFDNISQFLSTSRYDTAQDELSLEMDARSDGFTSRICDTANSLLLGEFPWGSEKRNDYVIIKQKRIPKPVPVRIHIGPPNSSSLMQSDSDSIGYENEECNSSKSLIHALRALSRKRTHSFMNDGDIDNDDRDENATASKLSKPIEHRHNLYLSQLEEDTPEYKIGLKNQTDQHLERSKRLREDDTTNSNGIMGLVTSQDVILNKRQCTRSQDDHGCGISSNGTNGILSQTNRAPRRGCNEIISSLSSSLSMIDPKLREEIIKRKVKGRSKDKHKRHKKVVAVETQTQTTQPIVEVTPEIITLESPKKEDKSINTDPIKPVIIEEKVVTDKMANALMKSAVRKFLATEDPSLSPIRNPSPPVAVQPLQSTPSTPPNKETLLPTMVSSSSNLLQPTSFTGNVAFSAPSTDKPSFTFGPPVVTTSSLSIPNISTTNSTPSFTFENPTIENKNTITTSTLAIASPFTSTIETQAPVTSLITSTSTEKNVKQISFGDNKLENSFKLPEAKLDLKDDKSAKTSTTVAMNLFGQVTSSTPTTASTTLNVFGQAANTSSTAPTSINITSNLFGQVTSSSTTNSATPNLFSQVTSAPATNSATTNLFGQVTSTPSAAPTTVSVTPNLFSQVTNTSGATSTTTNAVTSDSAAKPTFSFPFSSSSSNTSVTTSSDPIKTSTFSFGNTNANLIKPIATPSFGSTGTEIPKTTNEPLKLPPFGSATTKPSESLHMSAESTNSSANINTTSTGGFSFGGNKNEIKKSDSANPTQSKAERLFSFGSTTTTSTAKTENKPFGFGGTTSNSSETTQPAQQQTKPVFQFGSSSFSTTQPNKDGFSFGAKPAQPAPTSSFGSGAIFGAKPSIPVTSTSVTTASTTATGLFGFGAVQPAVTTVTPTFGSVTSTTNSNLGGFNASKSEDKPSSGGFPFKFTGGTSGSTAEAPKPSFSFGASPSQNPAPPFGSTSIPSQPTFGNVAPAASSSTFPAFGTTPSFGSSPAAPSPAPAFGSSNVAAPSATPVFGASSNAAAPNPVPAFGSSTPAAPTPAPPFGSSSAPTFGSSNTTQPAQPLFGSMQTQPTQGPSFTFGASSTPASSGGFNFGSSAQPPPAQPASTGLSMFQFGSSATQQNPAGGVQPFQFGASNNAPAPGFGFSSTLGGFNPGVGGGQPMFSIGSGSTAPRSRQPLSRRKK